MKSDVHGQLTHLALLADEPLPHRGASSSFGRAGNAFSAPSRNRSPSPLPKLLSVHDVAPHPLTSSHPAGG
jgi:hypothetical protein